MSGLQHALYVGALIAFAAAIIAFGTVRSHARSRVTPTERVAVDAT